MSGLSSVRLFEVFCFYNSLSLLLWGLFKIYVLFLMFTIVLFLVVTFLNMTSLNPWLPCSVAEALLQRAVAVSTSSSPCPSCPCGVCRDSVVLPHSCLPSYCSLCLYVCYFTRHVGLIPLIPRHRQQQCGCSPASWLLSCTVSFCSSYRCYSHITPCDLHHAHHITTDFTHCRICTWLSL